MFDKEDKKWNQWCMHITKCTCIHLNNDKTAIESYCKIFIFHWFYNKLINSITFWTRIFIHEVYIFSMAEKNIKFKVHYIFFLSKYKTVSSFHFIFHSDLQESWNCVFWWVGDLNIFWDSLVNEICKCFLTKNRN